MRVVIFCHSLASDWNNGNAHFLRGIVSELLRRGCDVQVYEPALGWSMSNLLAEPGGADVLARFRRRFPRLRSIAYSPAELDLPAALDGADLVIVHEWNEHELVAEIGRLRKQGGFRLLFHDTHHRSLTSADQMGRYDLSGYDGVLAFGGVVRDIYLKRHWARRAWTWHEAADVSVFRPLPAADAGGDLVWIGNWGEDERTRELNEFLVEPARDLGLRTSVYGVRYPGEALEALSRAGIEYGGFLPNFEAPLAYAAHKVTVHVPRRPYAEALAGIPTIRVFEAMACGIPLVSAPWSDCEGLFTAGRDYLVARDGAQMRRHLRALVHDSGLRRALRDHALATIHARHTCGHRVDQLFDICRQLELSPPQAATASGRAIA